MLTTKTKYAIMGVLDIASANSQIPIKLSDVARRQNIAHSYLEQLFNKLKHQGIVKSVKGSRGGYLLNYDAKEITVNDIILAVDEKIKITRCNSNIDGCLKLNIKCLSHYLWEGLEYEIKSYFSKISLDDILSGRIKLRVLKARSIQA